MILRIPTTLGLFIHLGLLRRDVCKALNTEINPLNAELNPIYHLLALLETHHILHVSRIRVNAACVAVIKSECR